MDGRPTLSVTLPEGVPDATARLVAVERPQLETLTGCRVVDGDADRTLRWVVDIAAPAVSIAETDDGYCAVVRSLDDVTESLGLLRGLDGRADAAVSPNRSEAVDRLDRALRGNFAGAHLRTVDWDGLRTRYEPDVLSAPDPLSPLQQWLAELGDVHTAARPSSAAIAAPYAVAVKGDRVQLRRVRPGTAAYEAGVRAGWSLVTRDATQWWRRSGGPAHMRPLIAGRRLMSATPGAERHFTARGPDGASPDWVETYAPTAPRVDARLHASALVLTVDGWNLGVLEALATVLAENAGRETVVLDLRGNAGGNLVAALSARDRFVHSRTECGTIRYTDGRGNLGAPTTIVARPDGPAWRGRLVVVTDGLTASASEDFLLGLRGLPQVRVVGAPTTGASGRAITRHLLDGVDATISSALTYDRDGRCVEGAGIPVDEPVDPFDDDAVRTAVDVLVR